MRLIKAFLLVAGALVVSVVGVRAVHACSAVLKPVDQVIRESDTIVRARVIASPGRPVAGCLSGILDIPKFSGEG